LFIIIIIIIIIYLIISVLRPFSMLANVYFPVSMPRMVRQKLSLPSPEPEDVAQQGNQQY